MKAIDTNILIQFLTGDDEQQAKKVYSIFKEAESEKKRVICATACGFRNDLGFRICL